jgi:predicted enzyme related to lactoylglutathione lyase
MTPHSILIPVRDVAAAVAFYRDSVGLVLKFQDGDRYAAFEFGSLTLALLGAEERIVDVTTLSFRVDDIRKAEVRTIAGGGHLVAAIERGPHESRCVLDTPGGNIVLSQKHV